MRFTTFLLAAALFAHARPLAGNNNLADSMDRKLQHIQQNGLLPHPDQRPTVLTEPEVNAYFAAGRVNLPAGVQSLVLHGTPGVITGDAHVDFDRLKQGRNSANPLLSIFSGVHNVEVIANSRGVIKGKTGQPPKIGGIIYTESAEKVAYFIENANRERIPILFVQDVSGFMVGTEAEHSGIIRAGARFVEAMATATVPKLVLTVNHASGAGYYAMAGQGFDPDFIVSWPTGRMGVMEGESAIQAVFGNDAAKPDHASAVEAMRADYDQQLDARFAAARGFVDAVVTPEETRDTLAFLLDVTHAYPGPHLGAFVFPDP